MNRPEYIEQLVRKALDQFETPERLPADPFFASRVLRRIGTPQPVFPAMVAQLRPALLALLVIANITAALWHFSGSITARHEAARREMIELLSDGASPGVENAGVSVTE